MNFQTAVFFSLVSLPLTWALLATPNSPCASVCIDSASNNASDASSFNTLDTDLTCSDSKYNSTDAGKKFRDCNTCLLNSTAEGTGVSDQEALIYNLRASVDLCIWGFPNASSTVSSSCNVDSACAPLKKALTSDNLVPSNDTEWNYCSADSGAFLGSHLTPCIQCLQSKPDEMYIANFLIALEAGCKQKPQSGQTIGISGAIFSTAAISITSVQTVAPEKTSSKQKLYLIVGIAVGIFLVLAIATAMFIFFRRRLADKRAMIQLKSDCDTRYGAQSISAPIGGGFAQPPAPTSREIEKDNRPEYERRAQQLYGGREKSDPEAQNSSQVNLHTATWPMKPSSPMALPTHPAYLSREYVKKPPPAPIRSLKPASLKSNSKPNSPMPSLYSRRDEISPSYSVTTFVSRSEYAGTLRSPTTLRSPSTPGSRLQTPGLPATPKASLFHRFGALARSPRTPGLPPKTPNDIWN